MTDTPALELRDVDVVYTVRGIDRPVLRGVSLEVGRGESYGLVGESGCGKSTAALAIVRYLARNGRVSGGSIAVAGRDVLPLRGGALRRYRAETVSMVYQNPGAALNPSIRVGAQVAEAFTVLGASRSAAEERSREALAHVQIADPGSVMSRFPHQLSGGMQQRVVIAMALAKNPALLVLDEPTTGLDATVEAEVLDLVSRLQRELHTSVLFISHNLGVISKMCSRVGVLYAGRLVEEGPVDTVLRDPRHPYTVGLLRCIPRGGVQKDHGRLDTIPGFLPALGTELPGCVFADRCALADERCRIEEPPLITIEGGHESRCWYHERAPELPREEAADLEIAPVDRDVRADRQGRGAVQGVQAARPRGARARRRQRGDLARRDARARRRVGQRQDDAREDAARHRPADVGNGASRGRPPPHALPEAIARAAARAPDRLPESRLGTQPAPLGAAHPAPVAEEARRGRAARRRRPASRSSRDASASRSGRSRRSPRSSRAG